MEPLKFSDHVFNDLEELIPINEEDESSNEPVMLVVEDHLVNQKLFRIILEKSGYNVLTADNGLEALNIIKESKIDIVFMDCQMPVMKWL